MGFLIRETERKNNDADAAALLRWPTLYPGGGGTQVETRRRYQPKLVPMLRWRSLIDSSLMDSNRLGSAQMDRLGSTRIV